MSSAFTCGICNLPAVCATALNRMALGVVALIAVSALALATASMQPDEDWLNKESFQVKVPFGCWVHSAVDAIGPLNAVVGSQKRTTMAVLASKWLARHGARGGKTVGTSESHESIVAPTASEEGRPQEEPMSDTRETKSLAVLIHADNTGAKNAQAIFEEIVKLGEANVSNSR